MAGSERLEVRIFVAGARCGSISFSLGLLFPVNRREGLGRLSLMMCKWGGFAGGEGRIGFIGL
uniref:Uncharacterized protein n=1 Tax=Arundo donax TaxID=35708 RepID=A0A0A9GUL0_ARUDO